MESMQRVIKKFTNEIIDLNKNKGEGNKPLKPFMNKITDYAPQIPLASGINIKIMQWKIIVVLIMQTILKQHASSS